MDILTPDQWVVFVWLVKAGAVFAIALFAMWFVLWKIIDK